MTGWLKDYVALITGGGSGIGRAVAERFVAEGASVTIIGRNFEQLVEVAHGCADPSRIHAFGADVRDSDQLHHAVADTVRRFGKLDTLVANAGIWDYHRQLTKLTAAQLEQTFDEVFGVNVKGYLLAAEASWRELVKTRGSIVMTLSNASFYVNGGGPIYTASKHACLGLMRELAFELAPKVRVNGVACRAMNTNLRGPEALDLHTHTGVVVRQKESRRLAAADPAARLQYRTTRFHRPLRTAGVTRTKGPRDRPGHRSRRWYRRPRLRDRRGR